MDIAADLVVDFMDMTNDRRLLSRMVDARPGYVPEVGAYAVVSDDDASLKVARVLSIDEHGIIDLKALAGPLGAHRHLLRSI